MASGLAHDTPQNIPQNKNFMILLDSKKHPSHNSTSSLLFPIIFAPSRGGSAALSRPSTFTRTKKRGSSEYLSWRGRCRATQRTKRFLLGSASSSSSQNAWETSGCSWFSWKPLLCWSFCGHGTDGLTFFRGETPSWLILGWHCEISWREIVSWHSLAGVTVCLAGCHTSWNQEKWLGRGNKQQNLSTSTTTLW